MSTATLSLARYRAFYFDGNDNPPYVTRVDWWRLTPEVGERVLLCDYEHNVMLGDVVDIVGHASKDDRTKGYVSVAPILDSWMDGDDVLTLAVERMEQTTSNPISTRVSLTEAAA